MAKKDKLTFSVKSSLVVGTATAALSMGTSACINQTITSNPIPPSYQDTNVQDTSDAGETGVDPDADESADADDSETSE
jgi:hypothetical protein